MPWAVNDYLTIAEVGIDALCEQIADGQKLRAMAYQLGVSKTTLIRWFNLPDNVEKYTAANKAKAALLVDEIAEVVDNETLGNYLDENGQTRVDAGAINRAKMRVEHRRWLAAKLDRERYGEPDKTQNIEINLNSIHLELLRSQPSNNNRAQVIEAPVKRIEK